jgi:[ribosomal protein S18]-alanine N-acetyltransferase
MSTPTTSLPTPATAPLAVTPAVPLAAGHRLVAMTPEMLDAILTIENVAFSHPWSRGNFADALRSGYHAQVLLRGEEILGYFLAMQILDEVHLLNITVSPVHQGQGFARELLDVLSHWSRHTAQAQWLWLEVRESNSRARQLYERYGFRQIGARKKYYPVHHGERETAILMNLPLWP